MTRPQTAVGVILAGGLSRRMDGREKAFLPLDGKPLIRHVIDRLGSRLDALAINANGDPARFAEFGLPVIADTIPGYAGPLAGILAGMRWAQEQHPQATHIVTAAADTPFFPTELAERLLSAAQNERPTVAIAVSDGHRHPVFGCWPVALADELEAFMHSGEGGKVMVFAQNHAIKDVPFASTMVGGASMDPFFNINTPADLDIARAVAEGATHGA
jgi:molybdopterin-guanine dinucleotide biosynthesis protein A